MSSGSISCGSYPSLARHTALRPCEPAGRYESRFTQWMQSMCVIEGETKYAPLSPAEVSKPISALRSIACTSQRFLTYGKSKLSPLYVTTMCGLSCWMCSTKRRSVAASSRSLKTWKGPGNSGLGVYSKDSMSSDTVSRLMMR